MFEILSNWDISRPTHALRTKWRHNSRGAIAAAERVRADDEKLVRVDGETGTHELLPPPRGRVALETEVNVVTFALLF